jgi:hypothetical protein
MTVRARVISGRLVVDEATDLPDGTEIDLTETEPSAGSAIAHDAKHPDELEVLAAIEAHAGPLPPWMAEELDRREREDAGTEQDGDVVMDRLMAKYGDGHKSA